MDKLPNNIAPMLVCDTARIEIRSLVRDLHSTTTFFPQKEKEREKEKLTWAETRRKKKEAEEQQRKQHNEQNWMVKLTNY
jgi:hypothetical protein